MKSISNETSKPIKKIKYRGSTIKIYTNYEVYFNSYKVPMSISNIFIFNEIIYYTALNEIFLTRNFIETTRVATGELVGKTSTNLYYVNDNRLYSINNTSFYKFTNKYVWYKHFFCYISAENEVTMYNVKKEKETIIRRENVDLEIVKYVKKFLKINDQTYLFYDKIIEDVSLIFNLEGRMTKLERVALKGHVNETIKYIKNENYKIAEKYVEKCVGMEKNYKRFKREMKDGNIQNRIERNKVETNRVELVDKKVKKIERSFYNKNLKEKGRNVAYKIIRNEKVKKVNKDVYKEVFRILSERDINISTDINDNDLIRKISFTKRVFSKYLLGFILDDFRPKLNKQMPSVNGTELCNKNDILNFLIGMTYETTTNKNDIATKLGEEFMRGLIENDLDHEKALKLSTKTRNTAISSLILSLTDSKQNNLSSKLKKCAVGLTIHNFNTNNVHIVKLLYEMVKKGDSFNQNYCNAMAYFVLNRDIVDRNFIIEDLLAEVIMKDLLNVVYNKFVRKISEMTIVRVTPVTTDRDEVYFYKYLAIYIQNGAKEWKSPMRYKKEFKCINDYIKLAAYLFAMGINYKESTEDDYKYLEWVIENVESDGVYLNMVVLYAYVAISLIAMYRSKYKFNVIRNLRAMILKTHGLKHLNATKYFNGVEYRNMYFYSYNDAVIYSTLLGLLISDKVFIDDSYLVTKCLIAIFAYQYTEEVSLNVMDGFKILLRKIIINGELECDYLDEYMKMERRDKMIVQDILCDYKHFDAIEDKRVLDKIIRDRLLREFK